MSSKTRIVVFHMKEIIYTAIFAALGILLVLLLLFMFLPDHSGKKQTSKEYTPGIYTASMTLNNMPLEVEVSVDKNHINSIRFSNLDESVETMYPLVQPAMEEIAGQIIETQSADQIKSGEDDSYTSNLILDTIQKSAEKKPRQTEYAAPGFPLSFYNQILPFRKHKHFGRIFDFLQCHSIHIRSGLFQIFFYLFERIQHNCHAVLEEKLPPLPVSQRPVHQKSCD